MFAFSNESFFFFVYEFRPDQGGSLAYLTKTGMTFLEVENLLKETTHALYPVVVTREQPYIVGQVQRRDLQIVLSMFNQMKIAIFF